MADFKLGRLKFKWRGDWQTSTGYVIDDIVKYGGNTYVCIANHTSPNDYFHISYLAKKIYPPHIIQENILKAYGNKRRGSGRTKYMSIDRARQELV